MFVKFLKEDPKGREYSNKRPYQLGIIEEKLKFFTVQVYSNTPVDKRRSVMKRGYEEWRDLLEEVNEKSESGMKSGSISAGDEWIWMEIYKEYLDGSVIAIVSILLSLLLLVYPIILRNALVILIALFIHVFSFVFYLALLYWTGYQWGAVECLIGIVGSGVSAQYPMVFSILFIDSPTDKIRDRVRDSLRSGGTTLLGMLLTAVFGVVPSMYVGLLGDKKAAIFLVAILVHSFFLVLFLQTAILFTIGPKRNCGYICNCFCALTREEDDEEMKKDYIGKEESISQNETSQKIRNNFNY